MSSVINLRLPEDLKKKLDMVSKETNRNKSFIIRKALETYLDEYIDYLIALDRLNDKDDEIISFEELKNRVKKTRQRLNSDSILFLIYREANNINNIKG